MPSNDGAVNDIVDVDALFGDVEAIGPFTVGDDDITIIGKSCEGKSSWRQQIVTKLQVGPCLEKGLQEGKGKGSQTKAGGNRPHHV